MHWLVFGIDIFISGYLNANFGKDTKKVSGVLDGIVCDCPDDCDQTFYNKVNLTYVLKKKKNFFKLYKNNVSYF